MNALRVTRRLGAVHGDALIRSIRPDRDAVASKDARLVEPVIVYPLGQPELVNSYLRKIHYPHASSTGKPSQLTCSKL